VSPAPAGPLFISPPVEPTVDWLRLLPILVALPAAAILTWGLVRGRLPPAAAVEGLVLPVAAYALGMLMVMEKSKEAQFCGSCHVMEPVVKSLDATDGSSLAAIHYTRGLVPTGEASTRATAATASGGRSTPRWQAQCTCCGQLPGSMTCRSS